MDVEVRFVEGCPNLPVTRQRLAAALDAVGRPDIGIRLRAVRTDAEAGELGFTGSPTILIDGCDAFPDCHAVAGLSCRIYRTIEGASGSPSVEQLTTALADADRGLMGAMTNGGNTIDRAGIAADVERARAEFHRLLAEA